jgi:glycosyltransferase involved in cell wall biosynthesis
MKLIIPIPCFNERETLPETVAALPREIAGIDEIEFLIIDDGSGDGTSELARAIGVHHIVRFSQNRGLARGFMAGIEACLRLGADIIVNTDADNQYNAADIPALVGPILRREADLVVGDRQVGTVAEFSSMKKRLQRFGSWVVRLASNTEVPDATSGFRAISRDAALRMLVTNEFTYTLETLIQAGASRLAVTAVPIRTNPKTRDSRLFRSIGQYIRRSGTTILRIYTMYRPLRAFMYLAAALFLAGTALGLRFLIHYLADDGPTGHIQSLILTAILLISAFIVFLGGVIADLVGANRKLLEDVVYRLRRLEYGPSRDPLADERSATPTAAEPAPPPAEPGAADPGAGPEAAG